MSALLLPIEAPRFGHEKSNDKPDGVTYPTNEGVKSDLL